MVKGVRAGSLSPKQPSTVTLIMDLVSVLQVPSHAATYAVRYFAHQRGVVLGS